MMLEEEAQVIAGLLVGLNVIDCNMGIKDEDLDKPVMPFAGVNHRNYEKHTIDYRVTRELRMVYETIRNFLVTFS